MAATCKNCGTNVGCSCKLKNGLCTYCANQPQDKK